MLREIDELDTAALWLAEAMDVYRRFGDTRMQHRAEYLHAAILYRQGNYSEARSRFRDLLPRVEKDGDTQTVAMTLNGLAQSAIDLQDFRKPNNFCTSRWLHIRPAGSDRILARSMGLARLHVSRGRFAEGIVALREVQSEFRKWEIPEETIWSASISRCFWRWNGTRTPRKYVRKCCRSSREEALRTSSAVEYLREATKRQQASRALMSQVRSFIEKSSQSPIDHSRHSLP